MIAVDLSKYKDNLTIKNIEGKPHILDPIRKKYIRFLPEEFVRQLLIQYFLVENIYPKSLIQVEKQLIVNGRINRFDAIVFDKEMKPFLVIECKAPEVNINQNTLDQISRYNINLQAPYLLVTNGRETHCCEVNLESQQTSFMATMPDLK